MPTCLFVPFGQDNAQKKPNSMVAHTGLLVPAEAALEEKTISADYSIGRKTMCGIAGFSSYEEDYGICRGKWEEILETMNQVQKRRGPDEDGIFLDAHCGMAHVRLCILDLKRGQQPMSRHSQGRTCTICFNGEIYNMKALRKELEAEGAIFQSDSDTEVFLVGYMLHGENFVKRINGVFGAALWDSEKETLFLFRDRAGVKPLFYTKYRETLVYASELKGILSYPGMEAVADTDTLCEIFALGPAKTYGKGVLKDIYEVLPGHYLVFHKGKIRDICYWKLESHVQEASFEETVEKTSWLIEDAVKLQMLSDVPVSTFLSGGVDSSLVTAICAKELKKQGKTLRTFSFDFEGNRKYFKANRFQPSQDRPWVEKMVEFCQSEHTFLECDNIQLLDYLYKAVDARDLPCMADVESSMLYFCSKVAEKNKVALTGECADEIFGGYPWFHNSKAFETRTSLVFGYEGTADALIRRVDTHAAYGRICTQRLREDHKRDSAFGRGDRYGKEKKRDCLSEPEMVYGYASGQNGPNRNVLWSGGQSSFCRPPDYRICVECAVGNEMPGRCGKRIAAPCRGRKAAERSTVEKEKPVPQNLPSRIRKNAWRQAA